MKVLITLPFALAIVLAHPARAADQAIEKGNASAFSPEVRAEDFAAHVRTLASDVFAGRAPDTDSEDRTTAYLHEQFERMGLQPGIGDRWFQDVPVIASTVDTGRSHMQIAVAGKTHSLKFGKDAVFATNTGQQELRLSNSALVFAGYGIDAPEQDWHDYAGVDVVGKTVVVLAGVPDVIRGTTWYSRYGYKLEEAARQGAAATLVVHDEGDAGYSWEYVSTRASMPQFDLPIDADPQPPTPVRAWISAPAADALFAAAGMSLRGLQDAARKRGFHATPVGDARMSVVIDSTVVGGRSRNIVAKLRGTRHPDEAIVYSAHWDHLGTHPGESGDNIYNGAIDNATGVAALLEVAAQFAGAATKPERSVVFVLPTLEESGLLGSKYYTLHPAVPIAKTVVDINFDALVPVGPASDFVVVGLGMSDLDDVVKPFVLGRHRTLEAESRSEKDSFFRSDHLSFARAGAPVLFMRGGTRTRGAADPPALWNAYGKRYHTPADEFDPHWDLRGIVQDIEVSCAVGWKLANGHEWPNWHADSAFRAIRDGSRAAAVVGMR
ncbi:M28 family peptidase [Dokdonella sp.]|uniref:M28 family peptidase n=1 Tax=Dokdonella sp. TaxID=2291710 RepID=UPI0037845A29